MSSPLAHLQMKTLKTGLKIVQQRLAAFWLECLKYFTRKAFVLLGEKSVVRVVQQNLTFTNENFEPINYIGT